MSDFDGDLDDYARWLGSRRNTALNDAATETTGHERKTVRKAAADRRKQLKPLQSAVDKAELRLNQLASERKKLEDCLADPALYTDDRDSKQRLAGLIADKHRLDQALAATETDWLEASTALELALQ